METMPVREPAIERGIRWLLERQLPNGGWTRQAVNGVFFGAAMLDYRLYHTYFPVWALTRYNCLANET
jgi:lanosterol synthase